MASANNAANALARTADLSSREFLEEMNARMEALGLINTAFVDPTGIELGAESRSTSFEDANALADWAWETHEWQKQL